MNSPPKSAIARFVQHHDGPTNTSKLLGGTPVYQEVARWVARGWASPMHILRLEPHMPPGMRREELHGDRDRARAAALAAPKPAVKRRPKKKVRRASTATRQSAGCTQ